MRKLQLLLAGVLCLSVLVHAGEVITNDTGEDATGLRVTFSNSVLITDFGEIFTLVNPQMSAFEFVFSGGIVEPWGSHWMNWAPATASVVEVEWLDRSAATSALEELSNMLPRKPLIVAHRGASQEAPENTIPAFELAWEHGADAIEGDFRLTRDGHIVCMHDDTTGRVAGRNLVVSQSTLESLRALDVGAYRGEKYKGTVIPTLAEVLETVPAGKKIYIEVKTDESILPKLLDEVAASGLQDNQIVVISFNSNVLREVERVAPQYKTLWLSGLSRSSAGVFTPTLEAIAQTLSHIGADGFSSSWDAVDESIVESIAANGYEYHVWTVNDVEPAERFISWGVSSITTDVPGSMMRLPSLDVPGFTSNLLPLHVEGRHVLDANGNEVILRGASVDHYPPAISSWGDGPVLKRDLVLMREWGANAIRIPVFPSDFFAYGEEEHLRAYVDPLVQWAGELGLYVNLSWHTNGDPLLVYEHASAAADPNIHLAKDAWKTISKRYADCHWVLFQVFAEPDHVTWEVFRPMMTELVDIVRGNAPDSIVIVPGTDFAADLSEIPAAPIARSNILYATDVYPWVLRTDWEDDLVQMLNSDLAVLVAEWGFGRRFGGHLATSTDFGFPAIDLFDRYGIGWLTWQWTHYPTYQIRMFLDYERMWPVGPGIVMYQSLADLRTVLDSLAEPPVLEVSPAEALTAGCRVVDLLEQMTDGSSYTMIRAKAFDGWEFVGWEGAVDYPESTIVSVPRNGQRLIALFANTEPQAYEGYKEPSAEIWSTSQAVEVVGKSVYIVDWSTGGLQRVDIQSGEIQDVAGDFPYVNDIASDGDNLIIVSEDGSAWIFDTATEESTPLDLGASVSGEVLGVAHDEDTLYLLVYGSTGPSIMSIIASKSETTSIQVATAGELISLQMWNDSLLTLDYATGIGYRLVSTEDSYTLEHAFNITDYVPAEEQASGGVRGFFLTDDAYYFTSISHDSEPGKLHIVPVAPDPLATSLQDWDVTDFGTNSGALETVRYGEDDHGSYLTFTNPSSELNVVLQLWSDSNDHDLSSAHSFFFDAVSMDESTDLFVEFIHDDAALPEGALFASNEENPFTLTESGGLTISPEDLSVSAGTSFPWDDVDALMLHFRPSTAEIRFYGFRSAIQAAIKEMQE